MLKPLVNGARRFGGVWRAGNRAADNHNRWLESRDLVDGLEADSTGDGKRGIVAEFPPQAFQVAQGSSAAGLQIEGSMYTQVMAAHRQKVTSARRFISYLHQVDRDLFAVALGGGNCPLYSRVLGDTQHGDDVAAGFKGDTGFFFTGVHYFEIGQQRDIRKSLPETVGGGNAFSKYERGANLGYINVGTDGFQY
jgi:hypothetical protein